MSEAEGQAFVALLAVLQERVAAVEAAIQRLTDLCEGNSDLPIWFAPAADDDTDRIDVEALRRQADV